MLALLLIRGFYVYDLYRQVLLGQADRLGGLVVDLETRVRSLVQARIFFFLNY